MAVEQKPAKTILREGEERFRFLFDNMIEGNALHEIIYNEQGEPVDYRILEINAAYEKLFGIPREGIIGKCSREAYGTNEPPYLEIFSRVERTGRGESFETYHAGMGKYFIISVHSPQKREISAFFDDITERKLIEDALQQANKKLYLLSAITRHDILNQITILKGYLELSEDYISDSQIRTFVEKADQSALRIEELIFFTRTYEKLGAQAPVWQPVREIIGNVLQELPMGTVKIEVMCDDLEIYADRLFERVFLNLIENSFRHGGVEMTTIRLSSRKSNGAITFVVEDNGIGIRPEDKIRIFDRGFGKNSGFGLFLSREILSITRIQISETGNAGEGARFEIEIPHGAYRFITLNTELRSSVW